MPLMRQSYWIQTGSAHYVPLTHLEGLLIFCQICQGSEEPTVPDLSLVDVEPVHALEKKPGCNKY